jgi:hypothetical protein
VRTLERVTLGSVAPETFSSELGDVHEHGKPKRDSFSDEFRGASASLIEKDRPPAIDRSGRVGIAVLLVLLIMAITFCGFMLWYFAEPIGHWFAGLGRQSEAVAEIEPEAPEPAVAVTPDLPAEPAVEKVFGIRGAPDGSGPLPTPEPSLPEPPLSEPPVQPPPPVPPVQPSPSGSNIQIMTTDVRGKVSSSAIETRLAKLDEALAGCWAKAGGTGPVELVLSFGIKWNGSAQGISLRGGSEALHACVRAALPTSGWPQPRDGGEAKVTRTWKLGA